MKRYILGLLFSLCLVSPSWAAPVCGTVTKGEGSPPADPQTLVVTPSATGGVFIVAVAMRDSDGDETRPQGVTSSAGGTFTEYGKNVETGGVDIMSYLYYSVDYVGGAQTLSVDYNAAPLQGFIAAYVCTGVRLPNPWLGTATTNQSNASGSISIDVPCQVGGLAIDAATVDNLDTGTATIGATQTELYYEDTGTNNLDSFGSWEPGATTNTMSWSETGSDIWATVGGCLVPPNVAFGPLKRRVQ